MPNKNKWWKDESYDPESGYQNYNSGGEDSGPAGGSRGSYGGSDSTSPVNGSWLPSPKKYPGGGGEGEGEGEGGGGTDFNPFSGGWGSGAPRVPQFKAPIFKFGELWNPPNGITLENDPGYQFRLSEGLRAAQQGAAARGALNTGGTLKALQDYGQNYASQEFGNVFNRYNIGYNTRYGVARDEFDRLYTGAKDEYAPNLLAWQTNYAAMQHAKDLEFQKWLHDNLSAADIYAGGLK